ncbi:methionine synthase [Acidipropionibacterium virtanenii]|uniref:Cobalamin-independent methionine synthase MetE C-terminal/archaeal domain-containing protein n=1 Tax=Acidipropionibacterium virtanenii TaxID=2057246 RepID=A0A344UTY5_9ACTN|nr:methionine synthase [Acidipropionibacterium virtanenii]AXE38733.1 hypothetical protein JS278_01569 [Acidipropionibacterium virtanenii]
MRATGIGSLPGDDFRGALAAMGECFPELVPVPELPARGPQAGIIGRAVATLVELPVELDAAGWRVSDAPDRAARSSRSLLRHDLDDIEEPLAGEPATLKIGLCGPLTLAASLHLKRGEAVLDDPSARRDVAASLAAGQGELAAELHHRMPAVTWVWQIDEPAAPAVLGGTIPTQSGLHRYPALDVHIAGRDAAILVAGLREAGVGEIAWHCCAPGIPWTMMADAGVDDAMIDVATLRTADLDRCAEWLEAGRGLGLGLAPTGTRNAVSSADEMLDRLLGLVRTLGVDPALVADQGILTPACGLAGWSQSAASRQCSQVARAAELADEQLSD